MMQPIFPCGRLASGDFQVLYYHPEPGGDDCLWEDDLPDTFKTITGTIRLGDRSGKAKIIEERIKGGGVYHYIRNEDLNHALRA